MKDEAKTPVFVHPSSFLLHPFFVPAPRPGRNHSIAAARLADEADHTVAARRGVGPADPLRLLVRRAADNLPFHNLAHRLVAPVAEGVHREAVIVDVFHRCALTNGDGKTVESDE